MKTRRFHLSLLFWFLTAVRMGAIADAATIRVGHDASYDYTTISAALTAANAGDTITVADGTYNRSPPYPETFPLVMKSGVRLIREISGMTPVIDATSYDRAFLCDSLAAGAGTRIEGFRIINGYAPEENPVGGGLYLDNSELAISFCTFSGNFSEQDGGGIYCYQSSLTLTDCAIEENYAQQGGGIFVRRGSNLSIENCSISDNTVQYTGAGMSLSDSSTISIEKSEISGNDAPQYGGGIFCNYVDVNIFNCLITGNNAGMLGGGLYSTHAVVFCNQSAWIENSAQSGGGIGAGDDSEVKIFECVIGKNTVTGNGAGVFVSGCDLEMLFSKIAANDATSVGGGIALNHAAGIIAMCDIIDNHSVNGAGIHFEADAETQVVNCLFARNHATEFGGAFFFKDSSPGLAHCTMTDNYAADGGGAFSCSNANPILRDSILWDDDIDEVFVFSGTPAITFCDVEGGWSSSATNFDADPLFVTGADGEFFLSQTASGQPADSPCVNAGSGPSASFSYPVIDRTFYMDTLTTRTNNGSDSGQVDVGYHYDPAYDYCTEPGCSIDMPSSYYHPGDPFYLYVIACNPDLITYPDMPLFVLLDVYGSYFFAPSFTGFDYYEVDLYPGKTTIEVIPEFSWPPDAGTASGIIIYVAMTNHEMTMLFGAMDYVSFGWGP